MLQLLDCRTWIALGGKTRGRDTSTVIIKARWLL